MKTSPRRGRGRRACLRAGGAGAVVGTGLLLAGVSAGLVAGRGSSARTVAAAVTPGAATTVGSVVGVATDPGPVEPGTHVLATAPCPAGLTPVAGGLRADLRTGRPPSPSLRLDASLPSGLDPGGARPTSWSATVATGGVPEREAQTTAFSVCLPDAGARSLEITHSPGPRAAGSAARATAACPQGTTLVGGGGSVEMANGAPAPRYFFLTGSYPSTPGGAPVTGGIAPAWTTVGAVGGMPLQGGRVTTLAVCLQGRLPRVEVAVASHLGPADPSSSVAATASCPPGLTLTGGGADAGLPGGGRPPQGLHLRGSYPSQGDGRTPSNGERANSWTAIANAGGLMVLGARTEAFAVCAP